MSLWLGYWNFNVFCGEVKLNLTFSVAFWLSGDVLTNAPPLLLLLIIHVFGSAVHLDHLGYNLTVHLR